jgi:hypothetical protein
MKVLAEVLSEEVSLAAMKESIQKVLVEFPFIVEGQESELANLIVKCILSNYVVYSIPEVLKVSVKYNTQTDTNNTNSANT